MKKYLAMDIGGTFIKYSIMDANFNEEYIKSVPTKENPEEFKEQLLSIVDEVKTSIHGIAISIGGFLNPVTCENTDFSVGENFVSFNLKDVLSEYSGLPVSAENDSNCAALAEMQIGAGRECKDFCVMTIGTGIGGAIIKDRKLFRGKNYKAGEFGLCLFSKEKENGERYYTTAPATSDLVERVSKALGKRIDGVYVFNNLDQPEIREIYNDWIEDIALLVGNTAISLDPEKVLIGGGISVQEVFIKDLRDRVFEIFDHLIDYTKVEACNLGNHAGKIGALIEFFNRYNDEEVG
ncbi:MAG: ROK family protein [Anaerolineaceae bacterium]|nr:MAG: ROK family protein [Anaerolineaceae bacterium]